MEPTKPLVLVVEDSPVVRQVAIGNLNRYCDVEIKVACDGQAAVELAKAHVFALVLMDINMPGMDGIEATRRIRQLDAINHRHTPIVAVTASESKEACMAAGMDDFVIKPADYRRIADRWLPTRPN